MTDYEDTDTDILFGQGNQTIFGTSNLTVLSTAGKSFNNKKSNAAFDKSRGTFLHFLLERKICLKIH